jgi:hypothetical protein
MFTSDLRRRPPATFADLKERNYTIYNAKTEHYSYDFTDYLDESQWYVILRGRKKIMSKIYFSNQPKASIY